MTMRYSILNSILPKVRWTTIALSAALSLGYFPAASARAVPAETSFSTNINIQPMTAALGIYSPVPPLTDADRKAVYHAKHPLGMGDNEINYLFVFDNLEWQNTAGGNALHWNATGWIGGDIDRLWIRSAGKRTRQGLNDAEIQALLGHSISPWWDVVGGVRHNFKPGRAQTWVALGIQGFALYNFEAEATAYLGEGGQTSARIEGRYDLLITNRLILQPSAEINFYGKSDAVRGIGSGLSSTSLGVRLRYEIDRQFAPYVGVTWDRSYGNTARMMEADGQQRDALSFVAGVRVWF